MNTKPFNLKKALAGEPVVMRNGCKVKAVYCIKEAEPQKVLAILEDEKYQWCNNDGSFKYDSNKDRESDFDLFMLEEPMIKFLNVYKNEEEYYYSSSTMYDTIEQAIRQKTSKNYLKTIEITI